MQKLTQRDGQTQVVLNLLFSRQEEALGERVPLVEKIQNLETGQQLLAESLQSLDARVRELEAGLREAKAEIKLEAVKEAQSTVNGAQGQIYKRMLEIEMDLSKANGDLLEMKKDNLQIGSAEE